MTKRDPVDAILEQWSDERPELQIDSLGVVVRVMSLYRTFVRQAARALGPLDLELHEYDALAALRRQGEPYVLSATDLARETGLSGGAMTNRIDKLERRRLVRRKTDAGDRRGVNVSLTAKGKRIVDSAIGERLKAADESLAGISEAELRQLSGLLRKVVLTTATED